MANSVDLVIGSEAIKQVESLISKLSIADAELLKISQSAMGASKGIAGISTPSGLDKTVASTTALNTQLEKQNAIITKLHADIAKKAEQSRLAEIKLQQQREKAFDSFEKNAQKEAALNAKNETAYQRIQNSVATLTKTYQDLAIRKQLGSSLTAKEEAQLTSLTTRISTYQKALLATDAQIGKNQRNVGNYASGYNALGNSINQLSREAPAFANSVNTGFMALSNNIPILFDALAGVKKELKAAKEAAMPAALAQGALAKEQAILGGATEEAASALGEQATALALSSAEGVRGRGVMRQLVGAFFSWGTALSLGVTLLTIYGGALVEFAIQAFKGASASKTLAENQAELNSALSESSGKYVEEKVNIDVLYKTATDLSNSYKDRKKAVDDLQQQYPYYFKNLSDETIMVGDAKKQYDLLSAAISTTAKARAAEEILQKRESERLTIEQDSLEKITSLYDDYAKAKATSSSLGGTPAGSTMSKSREEVQKEIAGKIQYERYLMTEARKQWAKDDAFFVKKVAEGNAIEATLQEDKKIKVKKAKQKETKREDLAYLESYIKPVSDTVNQINAQIEKLKVIRITGTPEEREEAKKDIETLIELKKQLMGGSPTGGALPDFVVPDNAPAQTKLKSDWKETFNSIAESAQQAGDIIAEFSQRNFENEYMRLEAQKDISLKFAGDNAAAKQKIEEDYEKKHKEIANRENKAKQKQAIFNIAIDTAQAIMATVGKTGFAGLPLALTLGVLGAAQIAMVASQKIPQYFDGTDNHSGGLMIVNDGTGANFQEKIILPNGKEIIPEGRNVLMNAPKGTKVLTHEQQIMEMLNERGISMSAKYNQSNGMTAQEMDSVMAKHFAKIQTNNTTFDRNGFSSWMGSNGNKTIQNNNRVSRTGFKV